MKKLVGRLALLGVAGGVALAFLAWPRINDVETGKTPEYSELQPREYAASVDSVTKAAKAVLGRLPRWELVGEGKGSVGVQLQAVHTTAVFRSKHDVTIRIRSEGGQTRVSVRSKSLGGIGDADLGQNARNICAFLGALDAEAR